jgi:hypothetical protein
MSNCTVGGESDTLLPNSSTNTPITAARITVIDTIRITPMTGETALSLSSFASFC